MNPDDADISVRREDTENGFRWSIERASLDLKIKQELEFERRKPSELDQTGTNPAEPVQTGSHTETRPKVLQERSEPVQTSADGSGSKVVELELRAQLRQARAEVEFLREEQTHRRQTDKALGTVIEAFKLNADASRAQFDREGIRERSPSGEGQRHDILPGGRQVTP